MKALSKVEHVKILVILSDELWDELESGKISEIEYGTKLKIIKNELNEHISMSFSCIQKLANKLGYLIIKNRNTFGMISNYHIAKN